MRRCTAVLSLAVLTLAPCAAPAQTPASHAMFVPDPADKPASYESVVARRRLGKKQDAMRPAFPATSSGAAWLRIATLGVSALRQDHPDEARLVALDLAVLERDPAAAVDGLRRALPNLPSRFSLERQILIQLASRLPAPHAATVALLQAEMSRPLGPNPALGDALGAVVAADALLAVVPSPGERDAVFAAALAQQPDVRMRRLVLGRYAAVDAARAAALGRRLTAAP